ncbi:hypothetical protein LH51_02515 [Nitrincola sp. A-D6]|uniref:DUF4880 domain-containing protein n=1 Tax=Nitrincola sp. A-D6 TaxID=1545442 RepID=UPI00051FEC6B|nr:DUF4880 domain-containing protein [Nitrincola sp. A-D6]KGK43009.1 hypothetical protein LH51_02515 [Nitrincola sp. A-D6]
MTNSAIPPRELVTEAIHWLVKFEAGDVADDEQLAFTHWLSQSPEHALVWDQLGRANQQFSAISNLNSEKALHSLHTAEHRLLQKRRSLKTLASVSAFGAALWLTRDMTGAAQAGRYLYGQTMADVRTAAGEQKTLVLQDSSTLMLNTQSALAVDFSSQPELVLHYGELAITNSGGAQVRIGRHLFSPVLGSEFTLYRDDSRCHLQVVTGQVDCTLSGIGDYKVTANQGFVMQGEQVQQSSLTPYQLSWRQGLLTAQRTQLGDFIQQLTRYRVGYLGYADEVAHLTFSGSFPLVDTDAILGNLCQILPIRQHRVSKYWVRLMPA